jgi:cobyrinic acid a,c-diamide synthase
VRIEIGSLSTDKLLDFRGYPVVAFLGQLVVLAAFYLFFVNFRKNVRIAGVIFNKVGSERHFSMLQQVCDDLHIECFGYLPKSPELEQGSRYLGLDFSELNAQPIKQLEEHVKWQELLML